MNRFKKYSALSLGIGSSYLTYYYLQSNKNDLLENFEKAKHSTRVLYTKFFGNTTDAKSEGQEAFILEKKDISQLASEKSLPKSISTYPAPLLGIPQFRDIDGDTILSAVHDDLQAFKEKICVTIQDKESQNFKKLDKLSRSVDNLSNRIRGAEDLLALTDLDRGKQLTLLFLQEDPLKERIRVISVYLKSVFRTFGSSLSVPSTLASLVCPLHSISTYVFNSHSPVEDALILMDNGMVVDALEKLDQLEGIQRAIVKPAIVELRKLIELKFLNECQKVTIL